MSESCQRGWLGKKGEKEREGEGREGEREKRRGGRAVHTCIIGAVLLPGNGGHKSDPKYSSSSPAT